MQGEEEDRKMSQAADSSGARQRNLLEVDHEEDDACRLVPRPTTTAFTLAPPALSSSASTSVAIAAVAVAGGRMKSNQRANHDHADHSSLGSINLALLDPARWGWTAAGGVADVLPPHERARRRESKRTFLRLRQQYNGVQSVIGNGRAEAKAVLVEPGEGRGNFHGDVTANSTGAQKSQLLNSSSSIPSGRGAKKKRKGSTTTLDDKKYSSMKPVRFSALYNDSVLDMYTYHRGREGIELRDIGTGDLLCDVEATDTSYGRDGPDTLVAQVVVDFPLEDSIQPHHSEIRRFREVVPWDLGDPGTATPMMFAADVAERFGLAYPQTLELAESIENQLNDWVRRHCTYSQPLILKDSVGSNRDPPSSVAYSLYGNVTGVTPGGVPLPSPQEKKKSAIKSSVRGLLSRDATTDSSGRGRTQTSVKGAGSKTTAKRRRDSSSVPRVNAVGETYKLEVLRRLREESSLLLKSDQSLNRGSDDVSEQHQSDMYCHLCVKKVIDAEGLKFCGCGHAYCMIHMSERGELSLQVKHVSPLEFDYCPACALDCPCARCTRRLDALALTFKTMCDDQGVGPADAVVDSLLELSKQVQIVDDPKRQVAKRKKTELLPLRTVRKVPLSEFPREVVNGSDLVAGSELDFRSVYSATGVAVIDCATNPESCSENVSGNVAQPAEDGSIDYCIVCGKHGHLLCCDFCPRAFHSTCIDYDETESTSDTPWQCPQCKNEHEGIPEETMNGSVSLGMILSTFKSYFCADDPIDEDDLSRLRTLATVHEMVGYLMNYSFGYAFRDPVDCKLLPAYSKVIKNPMDLGTIASNIENGCYFRRVGCHGLDDVLSAVLKDIELVWHNCFTFNFPGSAIYRMAEVQRKTAQRIASRSIDASLSEYVRGDVDSFVASSQLSRGRQTQPIPPAPAAPVDKRLNSPQSTRHKIAVSSKGCARRRPIAVLDPETGMIVKIYTSLQSASAAIELFLNLNYDCEWDLPALDPSSRIRKIVHEGNDNPSFLLFGYRWLWLDDLRNGNVSFASKEFSAPRNEDGQNVPLHRKVKKDKSTTESVSSTVINASLTSSQALPSGPNETYSLTSSLPFGSTESAGDDDYANPITWAAMKYDAVHSKVLVYYKSVDEAYVDWLKAIKSSPLAESGLQTLDDFQLLYLDSDNFIDGAGWKSRAVSPRRATESPSRRNKLPRETVEYLKAWMMSSEHVAHPYPTEEEKLQIMEATGIGPKQLSTWFTNNRKRYWRVRYQAAASSEDAAVPKNSSLGVSTNTFPVVTSTLEVPLSSAVESSAFEAETAL